MGSQNVRVVLTEHPITKELAPCVPVMDYADVFSYDREALRRIIKRTSWLEKHTCSVIMTDHLGRFQPHQAIFEEAALGILLKMQPKRCKDPTVAAKVDQLQEELILILRDTLRGYRQNSDGYQSNDGKLPWPGMSMDAIATLCKNADKYFKRRVSLMALKFFTGMPVDDLLEELEEMEPPARAAFFVPKFSSKTPPPNLSSAIHVSFANRGKNRGYAYCKNCRSFLGAKGIGFLA